MSFVAFIAPYYEERLHFYERLDLTRCPEAELLDVAGEASALEKFSPISWRRATRTPLTDSSDKLMPSTGSNDSCPRCCSTWGVPQT